MSKEMEVNRGKAAKHSATKTNSLINDHLKENLVKFHQKKLLSHRNLCEKSRRTNKMYKTPPSPTFDGDFYGREKSYVLDCVAVGNISSDYTRANPKYGSAIPPYNSFNDKSIKSYLDNYGWTKLLKQKDIQAEYTESIAGRIQDKFYTQGAGYKYLFLRNKFGIGHHPELIDGHIRFMNRSLNALTKI